MNESIDTEPVTDYRYFKYRPINLLLIDSLVKSSLWFSKVNMLNDPFDCQLDLHRSFERAASSTTGRRKEWLQSAIDNQAALRMFGNRLEEVGVCSFSLNLDKPLTTSVLWSHYADEHRGVCLLYRIPESFILDPQNEFIGITKVNYTDNALTNWLKDDASMELNQFVQGLIKIYLTAKSPAWVVENEARIIRRKHGPLKIPSGFLEQVCFGLRTPPGDIELVEKLAREYCGCKRFCRIVRDNDSDFGIKAIEM